MTTTTIDPQAHDTRIAALYEQLAKARYYYRGRVTDMSADEAEDIVAEAVLDLQRWEETHSGDDKWVGYTGKIAPYDRERAGNVLHTRPELVEAVGTILAAIEDLEQQYTGWSRFFLVTSSQGHIHSSMHCPSCRPTTTYGWLPQLSGESESEAVARCGPNLCSVCFPTAPVGYVGGKLSKREASDILARQVAA